MHPLVAVPITNPKLRPGNGARTLFPYYAGFNVDFVSSALKHFALPTASVVLDPWNGSGTTVQVAVASGYRAVGVDINPVMLFVSVARLSTPGSNQEVKAFLKLVAGEKRGLCHPCDSTDALLAWFVPSTASKIRWLQRRIAEYWDVPFEPLPNSSMQLSPSAALAFVALFSFAKRLVAPKLSNPTWVRSPSERGRTNCLDVVDGFISTADTLSDMPFNLPNAAAVDRAHVRHGSSRTLPPTIPPADCVITSPPYCTRIDYVVSTRVELAVLGVDEKEGIRSLRDGCIGTTTVRARVPAVSQRWGAEACDLVERIASHKSKASANYYAKTYRQYFADMAASFASIASRCRDDAPIAIVVQDSYYKGLHVDLAKCMAGMAVEHGYSVDGRFDFDVRRSMLNVNSRSKRYEKSDAARESVLILRTGKRSSDEPR